MNKICLVGPMGSGKTTLGRLLAKRLSLSHVDIDDYLVEQTQLSIPDFFSNKGEQAFRSLEAQILKHALSQNNTVISTGGGAVLPAPSRQSLKEHPCVIYVTASADCLDRRLTGCEQRPLLQVKTSTEQVLNKLIKERNALYEEVADLKIDTTNHPIHDVLNIILEALVEDDIYA